MKPNGSNKQTYSTVQYTVCNVDMSVYCTAIYGESISTRTMVQYDILYEYILSALSELHKKNKIYNTAIKNKHRNSGVSIN